MVKTLPQVTAAEGPFAAGRPCDACEGAGSATASLLVTGGVAVGHTQPDKINFARGMAFCHTRADKLFSGGEGVAEASSGVLG